MQDIVDYLLVMRSDYIEVEGNEIIVGKKDNLFLNGNRMIDITIHDNRIEIGLKMLSRRLVRLSKQNRVKSETYLYSMNIRREEDRLMDFVNILIDGSMSRLIGYIRDNHDSVELL